MLELDKIHLGDSYELIKQIPDNSINCIITSPPYNKGLYDKHTPHSTDVWKQRNIKYGDFTDNIPRALYVQQQRDMLAQMVRVLKCDGSIFYNHKSVIHDHTIDFPTYVFDFNVRQIIIWDRGSTPQLAPIRFYPTTEYIFWITKSPVQPKFYRVGQFDKEVWRINAVEYAGHPAPFPYELAKQCVVSTTDENDVVYDPYSGSGTTAVVAHDLKRRYIGTELNKDYVKIANDRLNGIELNGQTSIFTIF